MVMTVGASRLEVHDCWSPEMVFPSDASLEVVVSEVRGEKHRQTWKSAEPDGQRQLEIGEAT